MNSAAPEEVNPMELWGGAGLTVQGLVALVLSTLRAKPGILLSAEGIVWHETFQPAAFIPWEALAQAVTFNNVVHYTSTPCFGLLVSDGEAVDMGKGRRESLYYQLAQ